MEYKNPINPEHLIKITNAATELGCSRFKIYDMVESGELDYIRINDTPIIIMNEKYNKLKNGTK